MQIKKVNELLNQGDMGSPNLNVLAPTADNYAVLLFQPDGHIEASSHGVKNRHREKADMIFRRFLQHAIAKKADLVITPEYSLPWDTLVNLLKDGAAPPEGALWVLGCESIKYSELITLKAELSSQATLIFEAMEPDQDRFVDPLAYVFSSPGAQPDSNRLVMLVQFKTHPMGDQDHFERNGLQLGKAVYQFGGFAGQEIRLISLICSDAFAFHDPDAKSLYDRTLVIHIQLNPKPRQTQYRQYRDRLLSFAGDATEILCLNWARDVCEYHNDNEKPWKNIAGSAWYIQAKQYDDRDATIDSNHKKGMYYTWQNCVRAHALFLNYEPAVYCLTATKVVHLGVTASVSSRRGPQLIETLTWNDNDERWDAAEALSDGFADIASACGNAADAVSAVVAHSPMTAERILALCAGHAPCEDWYTVRKLDSCGIDATEIIRRLTYCQDTDEQAKAFRQARLVRCQRLWDILEKGTDLPPALADLRDGFSFSWDRLSPHKNVVSRDGKPATAIYMGEETTPDDVEVAVKKVAEFLRRSARNDDDGLESRQRMAVWYRDAEGTIVRHPSDNYTRIDMTGATSEFDYRRPE